MIIEKTSFKSNIATISGGAIQMEEKIITENILRVNNFNQNKAPYGNNYASFPIKLKLKKTKQMIMKNKNISMKVQSGTLIGFPLQFILYDHFGQIVQLNFYESK